MSTARATRWAVRAQVRRAIMTSVAGALCMLGVGATIGQAEMYPARIVHVVIPYPPGGGLDALMRPMAELLSKRWDQRVILDAKPGASTIIGGEFVAKAPPDGYTLLFTSDATITSNPYLFRQMSYDPLKDLIPITQIVDHNQMVIVNKEVPAKSLQELIAVAKAQPGSLNYASYGNGSQPHLLFEALKTEAGISLTQIAYKGVGPALIATISNEVQMTLSSYAASREQVAAGTLRPIAISKKTRFAAFPDLPTIAETGHPDIDPKAWLGLFAPAGTPQPIVNEVYAAVAAAMSDRDFRDRNIEGLGYTGVASTPAEFAAFIKADYAYKGKLIKGAGVTPE
jgi:tripartite-type tricarboxylate transporter receptor subunit TctC